jgi:hypothetical protein
MERHDVGESFQVDIRLRIDPSLASRRILEGLKTETESIWAPYGVRLRWADASASAAGGMCLDASVERRFETRQRVDRPTVLGRVVVGPDAPAWRPIRVSLDATERVLALRTTGPSTMKGIVVDRDLARALGRVLAHEIGHVLIGPPHHDRAGLMRATFDANELAEPDTSGKQRVSLAVSRRSNRGIDRCRSVTNRQRSCALHRMRVPIQPGRAVHAPPVRPLLGGRALICHQVWHLCVR